MDYLNPQILIEINKFIISLNMFQENIVFLDLEKNYKNVYKYLKS